MQAISLRPQQRLIVQKRIAVYALAALTALVPEMSLPLTMLLALFSCPLMKADKRWITFIALPIPAVVSYLNGPSFQHFQYAFGLLMLAVLPACAAWLLPMKAIGEQKGFCIFLLSLVIPLAVALSGLCVGEEGQFVSLTTSLADRVEQWVMGHSQRTQLLYQAMATGVLPVPEGYERVTLLQLTLDPVFLREVRLMLRTRVMHLVETLLPSLFIQSCIIVSVFIGLRIQRMWGAFLVMNKNEPQKISVAMAPTYSRLRLANSDQVLMGLFLIFYLFFGASEGFMRILAQLMYHTFETAYQLLGGAIVCSLIMRKDQERRIFAGIVTAFLYLTLPLLLFVLGCFENMFSFRSKVEDDNEERENNEEEEP